MNVKCKKQIPMFKVEMFKVGKEKGEELDLHHCILHT